MRNIAYWLEKVLDRLDPERKRMDDAEVEKWVNWIRWFWRYDEQPDDALPSHSLEVE
jgi:hypothetical protein